MTPAKPRYSSKQLSHSLLLLRREFTALQDTWNRLCALMLLPTALEEFMTPLPNWNQLPSPAQDPVPPPLLPLPALPQMSWNDFLCLQDIELSTGQPVYGTNAKTHMDGKDRHYYPSGPRHIPTPSPLYCASCFITPHHPKRRFEDRWAIPPTLTGDDGHSVFHTITNTSGGPTLNHISPDEDLLVADAPGDYDDPFPDQPARPLDVRAFQLTQHLKGKWYHALRKATATDPLFDIISRNSNHASWIFIDGLLLKKEEDDSRDCPYIPYEAAYEGDNIRSEILRITHEQMAHMGARKCFKYASRHFYWMIMRNDF